MRVPAVLHGTADHVGDRAMCTLEMWTEVSSTGRRFTRCRITDDPPELPDGSYEVEFDAHRVTTRKNGGLWDLTFLSPDIRLSHTWDGEAA